MALECFACVMRYMGDMPLLKNQHEVDCVNTIFLYCRQFEPIRDEVYCQIMKQTTNNKSMNPVSLIEWLIYRITFSNSSYFIFSVLMKTSSWFLGFLSTRLALVQYHCSPIHKFWVVETLFVQVSWNISLWQTKSISWHGFGLLA